MYAIEYMGLGSLEIEETFYTVVVNDHELLMLAFGEARRLLGVEDFAITDAPFGTVLCITADDRLLRFHIRKIGSLRPDIDERK